MLHHYPSKEALLGAMVARLVERYAAFPDEGGAAETLPEYARRSLATPGDRDPLAWAVLAAAAQDLSMLAPVRAASRALLDRFAAQGVTRPRAALVVFALDGLWLSELLELSSLSADEREALARALVEAADDLA